MLADDAFLYFRYAVTLMLMTLIFSSFSFDFSSDFFLHDIFA